ncbi:MAG: hypothetical protein JWM70_1430 [Microbacteriaceae bacterium]|nr:hypothetical protein [Microbacteriaceae bacterium]
MMAALEPLLLRLDRIAGGRQSSRVIEDSMCDHPATLRTFAGIRWILASEVVVGLVAIVTAIVLAASGQPVPWAVWFRSVAVLGITVTLFYFAWRAARGFYWAYSRLRLFSKIFPIVTLVIAAIPGLYPLWMTVEQIIFSFLLIGVGDLLTTDHMRDAFPRRPAQDSSREAIS